MGRVILSPRHLILVRHGESTWNAEERLQGQLDPPLSERGREQARALTATLDGVPDERVDLQRPLTGARDGRAARPAAGALRPALAGDRRRLLGGAHGRRDRRPGRRAHELARRAAAGSRRRALGRLPRAGRGRDRRAARRGRPVGRGLPRRLHPRGRRPPHRSRPPAPRLAAEREHHGVRDRRRGLGCWSMAPCRTVGCLRGCTRESQRQLRLGREVGRQRGDNGPSAEGRVAGLGAVAAHKWTTGQSNEAALSGSAPPVGSLAPYPAAVDVRRRKGTADQTAHSPSPRMTWNGTLRFQSMNSFIVSRPNSSGMARSRTWSSKWVVPTRVA